MPKVLILGNPGPFYRGNYSVKYTNIMIKVFGPSKYRPTYHRYAEPAIWLNIKEIHLRIIKLDSASSRKKGIIRRIAQAFF
jgi:hypothetical protein